MIVYVLFVIAALIGLLLPFELSFDYNVCTGIEEFAIPAVAQVVSSIIGSNGQAQANRMMYQINKENREWSTEQNNLNRTFQSNQSNIARRWEEKMWNKSNEYNSPQATMARLQEAGLNPFLSGSLGQGASLPSAPMASSPSNTGIPSTPSIGNEGAAWSGLGALPLTMAEIELKQNQSNAMMVQAIGEASKGMTPENFEAFMKSAYPYLNPQGNESPAWKLITAQANAAQSSSRLQNAEAEYKEQLNKGGYAAKTLEHLDADINKMRNQSYQLFTEARENLANITTQKHLRRKLEAERSELLSRIARNVADARKSNADADSVEKYNNYALGFFQNMYDESVMNLQEHRAQYQSGNKVREYMKSDENQEKQLKLYEWEVSYWKKGLDEVKGILQVSPVKGTFGKFNSVHRNGDYTPPVGIHGFGQ